MIIIMCCYLLSVSCRWCVSVVLYLGGLYSRIKFGALQPLFVLFLLIDLMWLFQVTQLTFG